MVLTLGSTFPESLFTSSLYILKTRFILTITELLVYSDILMSKVLLFSPRPIIYACIFFRFTISPCFPIFINVLDVLARTWPIWRSRKVWTATFSNENPLRVSLIWQESRKFMNIFNLYILCLDRIWYLLTYFSTSSADLF